MQKSYKKDVHVFKVQPLLEMSESQGYSRRAKGSQDESYSSATSGKEYKGKDYHQRYQQQPTAGRDEGRPSQRRDSFGYSKAPSASAQQHYDESSSGNNRQRGGGRPGNSGSYGAQLENRSYSSSQYRQPHHQHHQHQQQQASSSYRSSSSASSWYPASSGREAPPLPSEPPSFIPPPPSTYRSTQREQSRRPEDSLPYTNTTSSYRSSNDKKGYNSRDSYGGGGSSTMKDAYRGRGNSYSSKPQGSRYHLENEKFSPTMDSPFYVPSRDEDDSQDVAQGLPDHGGERPKSPVISFPPTKFLILGNLNRFEVMNQIGEGTYGKVFKAQFKKSGKQVALKKVVLKEEEKGKDKHRDGFPITSMREIRILRTLHHPNIVELLAIVGMPNPEDPLMYMVFEYIEYDLTGLLNHADLKWEPSHIKCVARQLFEGIQHLHIHNIMHRDLKGANLLLSKDGILKIADFGLARSIKMVPETLLPKEGFDYTNRVVTLWYRSPELLLGATQYDFMVDIWSAGCIFMELYIKYPIFQGKTELDQCDVIFRVCGSPSAESWPGATSLPWSDLIKFEPSPRRIRTSFSRFNLSDMCLDLTERMLQLDPVRRPNIKGVLDHPFWSEDPAACQPKDIPLVQGDWHEYESKMRRKEDKKAAIPQAPGGSTQPGPDRTSTANTRTTDADAETKSVEPKSSQYDILVESNGAVPRSGESYRSAAVAPSHSRSTGVGMLLSERLNKRVRSLEPMDSAGEKKRKQLRPSRSPSPTRNGTSSRHGLQEDLNPKYEGRRSSNEAGNSRYRTRIEAIPALFMSL